VIVTLALLPLFALFGATIFYLQHHLAMSKAAVILEYLSADNSALEEGWIVDGDDLTLGRLLDRGAFGDVYCVKYKNELCMKMLNASMVSMGELGDLEQEIRFLKRIRHANLVRFYGAGEITHDGYKRPFLLLEFANRGSLRSFIRASTGAPPIVDWTLRVQLMSDVAKGLAHIHSLGEDVMHRDLKTANALVFEYDDGSLVAKVTDFGSVKLKLLVDRDQQARTGLTNPHANNAEAAELTAGIGTYLYMAPEVIQGTRTYTQAVDIFSFGVMLWEVATQESPDLLVQTHGPDVKWRAWDLAALLEEGSRLQLPDTFPMWYRRLMTRCFDQEPGRRPNADVVSKVMARQLVDQ
jgi:serine/threonine protein kinase